MPKANATTGITGHQTWHGMDIHGRVTTLAPGETACDIWNLEVDTYTQIPFGTLTTYSTDLSILEINLREYNLPLAEIITIGKGKGFYEIQCSAGIFREKDRKIYKRKAKGITHGE